MNTLNDSDELASLWKEWIDAAAKGVREFYPEMVRLRNLQSRARGELSYVFPYNPNSVPTSYELFQALTAGQKSSCFTMKQMTLRNSVRSSGIKYFPCTENFRITYGINS